MSSDVCTENMDSKQEDQSVVPLRSNEEVSEFMMKYNVPVNRKRVKALTLMSFENYECYKLNIICGICCKVRPHQSILIHSFVDSFC